MTTIEKIRMKLLAGQFGPRQQTYDAHITAYRATLTPFGKWKASLPNGTLVIGEGDSEHEPIAALLEIRNERMETVFKPKVPVGFLCSAMNYLLDTGLGERVSYFKTGEKWDFMEYFAVVGLPEGTDVQLKLKFG